MTSGEIQALLTERERLSVENVALRGQVEQLTGQLQTALASRRRKTLQHWTRQDWGRTTKGYQHKSCTSDLMLRKSQP